MGNKDDSKQYSLQQTTATPGLGPFFKHTHTSVGTLFGE